MTANTKRGYARSYLQTPIMYAPANTDDYLKAITYDNSVAGMSFETEHFLQPGTDIRIKMINDEPDPHFSPEAYKIYRAQVKWCKKILDDKNSFCYGIGVKFRKPRVH